MGTADERFTAVERHLRGLDVSMAEIGYRYGELLIAARERNWEYAAYQSEKIDLSLRLAVERRPKRAESARPFLADDLPLVLAAAKAKDAQKLDAALVRLHAGCVECHKKENVLYFKGAVDRIKLSASRCHGGCDGVSAPNDVHRRPGVGRPDPDTGRRGVPV